MSDQDSVAGKAPGTAIGTGHLARLSALRDYMLIGILAAICCSFPSPPTGSS